MKKQTVIVTGASTGLGRAIAQTFLERGDNVVINSSNADNLQKAYDELGGLENLAMVVGDISDISLGQKLVDAAIRHFGSVDVLVNNAGIFDAKPFLEVDENELDKYLSINFKGTFFITQAAIKAMLKQGEGSVINIGTVLVEHAIGGFSGSAPVASKAAIHSLTRQLSAEFGKNNIRVNTIAPGIIRTPLQGKMGVDNADNLAGLHLLNRVGEPSDIAEVAYMLAKSNFITGETINVDGGHVAGHHIG